MGRGKLEACRSLISDLDSDGEAAKLHGFSSELLLLAAESGGTLVEQCEALASEITEAGSIPYFSWCSQKKFDAAKPYRLAIVVSDEMDLKAKLERACRVLMSHGASAFADPEGVYLGMGRIEGHVAFLFPGQTQRQGLARAEWMQTALGMASLSYLAILKRIGIVPTCVAGHDFGELTALHAAGVLSVSDFLSVTRVRGELIAAAARSVGGGAMTAAAIPPHLLAGIESMETNVTIAEFNGPKQTVLAGDAQAIGKMEQYLEEKGIQCERLPGELAFHSSFVTPSCELLLAFLENVRFNENSIPVYSNVLGNTYPSSTGQMKILLAEQIAQPIRFSQQIDAMYEHGVRVFIEVGPGDVLTNLVAACLAQQPHVAVTLDGTHPLRRAGFWHALAQLAAVGVPMQPHLLWTTYAIPVDPCRKETGASGFNRRHQSMHTL